MIRGEVSADREARIRFQVYGTEGREEEVEAVLDTGFTGFLTLPPAMISALGLSPFKKPRTTPWRRGASPFSTSTSRPCYGRGRNPSTRQNWSIAQEYAHFLTDRYREEITLFIRIRENTSGNIARSNSQIIFPPAS